MRYGIFSDVHSNLEALDAVIAAYRQENIDQYLCVGDIVGYGANPKECIVKIKSLAQVTVAGNHDWASVDLFPVDYFNPDAAAAVAWTMDRLDAEDRQYLMSLQLVFKNRHLTLVHGTLEAPGAFHYMMDEHAARKTFAVLSTDICFVGHSHRAGIFVKDKHGRLSYHKDPAVTIAEFKKYIVNVGSVGQPRDSYPRAAYCVYDTEARQLEIKRIPYDTETTREKIIDAGLPAFLGDRLLLGK